MKTIAKFVPFMIGSLAISGMAYGQMNDTAYGVGALNSENGGYDNSAFGYTALYNNTSGNSNTAVGYQAMFDNFIGTANTATGFQALCGCLSLSGSGNANTATGFEALYTIYGTNNNTAAGYQALYGNFFIGTGGNNTATGYQALHNNYGSNNTAMGYDAGLNVTSGNNNIEIGNEGVATDNNVIRIGKKDTQSKTFIAGIYNNTGITGLAVVIGSNGELGAVSSSERFKTAIAPMGSNTEKLRELRPVTFHYKTDAQGTLRYGLIAEEVADVYPELVVRDDKGRIDGVRYDELAPMLLNEMQKQEQRVVAQDEEISSLKTQLADLRAALATLASKDQRVAKR